MSQLSRQIRAKGSGSGSQRETSVPYPSIPAQPGFECSSGAGANRGRAEIRASARERDPPIAVDRGRIGKRVPPFDRGDVHEPLGWIILSLDHGLRRRGGHRVHHAAANKHRNQLYARPELPPMPPQLLFGLSFAQDSGLGIQGLGTCTTYDGYFVQSILSSNFFGFRARILRRHKILSAASWKSTSRM